MPDPLKPPRRSRPLLLGAIAAGLAALAGLALYGTALTRNGAAPADPACAGAAERAARMAPLAKGEVAAFQVDPAPSAAPPIAFRGPDGQPLTLADLKGRTLLVNLWATWCAPCRLEMPALDRLQRSLGGADFAVVAISLDTRNADKPRSWLQENGIRALAYYADPDGRVLPALRSRDVTGLPTSLLVDPAGCQIGVLKGPAEWASEDALRLVRAALGR